MRFCAGVGISFFTYLLHLFACGDNFHIEGIVANKADNLSGPELPALLGPAVGRELSNYAQGWLRTHPRTVAGQLSHRPLLLVQNGRKNTEAFLLGVSKDQITCIRHVRCPVMIRDLKLLLACQCFESNNNN
jgi:hypothetical protein